MNLSAPDDRACNCGALSGAVIAGSLGSGGMYPDGGGGGGDDGVTILVPVLVDLVRRGAGAGTGCGGCSDFGGGDSGWGGGGGNRDRGIVAATEVLGLNTK